MSVPRLLILTDRHRVRTVGGQLLDTVAAAVDAGADTVLLRERDLPRNERCRLALDVAAVARRGGARFLVSSDPAMAAAAGADGLHLTATDPVGAGWHGRSCHDADALERAANTGAAYATLSPVAPTASKPGYGPTIGVEGTAELASGAPLPVVALGGIDPATAFELHEAGVSRVAVMGAVMGSTDPGAVVRRLVAAVAS
ncbi:thiamine phosphate synthase [Nitriliruptor alkaliphilus]|uniref:thiamine phosphate synthase n=1 Tax=Nitriliruptor alkaliphilus TaxID=427918 RepID=UPI000698C19C|nr:thiamine phosphate synthase [Nitriliruptor alkaliphilus]